MDASAPDENEFQEIKTFFCSMQMMARSGTPAEIDQILRESRKLHIPPIDLFLGILQPLLVEIGELWVSGQVSVATEHRFSSLVSDLMMQIRNDPSRHLPSESPQLVLINPEENEHFLGLMMAEYFFITHGIPTLAVIHGVTVKEAKDLIDFHKPKAVGFSVALPSHMRFVREVAECVKNLTDPPKHILVGGPAVRMGINPDPAFRIQICRQVSDLLPFLDGEDIAVKPSIPRTHDFIQVETVNNLWPLSKLKKILLVDDEEDVTFLMGRILKKAGVNQVETASGGQEALEKLLSGGPPDVLILDQNMPGMTGVQLMARVKDIYPDLPILFSSGLPGIETWDIFKQPSVGVISKPFTMAEILAKLAEFAQKTSDANG